LVISSGATAQQGVNIEVDGNLTGSGSLDANGLETDLLGNMTLTTYTASGGIFGIFSKLLGGGSGVTQNINGHTFFILENNDALTIFTGNVTVTSALDFQAGDIQLG